MNNEIKKAQATTMGPSSERIAELEKMGYFVCNVCDLSPPLYAWLHRETDAAQSHYKDKQPYRLSKSQAWDDCDAYESGNLPSTPNSDWMR